MRKSLGLAAACAVLFLLPAYAQQSGNTSLAGCLTGDGATFTLGAVPSGYSYRVQGRPIDLITHRGRLVRMTGTETTPATSARAGAFKADKIETLADSCTDVRPPEVPGQVREVAGKAGNKETAVPVTSTASVGQTTPGWMTAAEERQRRETAGAPPANTLQPPRGLLAPPEWDQVAQSPQEGDVNAAAAERAEQYPGKTLGISAMPSYGDQNAQGAQAAKRPRPVQPQQPPQQ